MYKTINSVDLTFTEYDVNLLKDICYEAERGIKESIRDHYICLQQADLNKSISVFKKYKQAEVTLLTEMFMVTGTFHKSNLMDELISYLKIEYKSKHGENE